MELIIEEPHNKFVLQIYLGKRFRYPSVTDVVFVSSDRIVVAHRYACKLYYIQFSDPCYSHHRIVDELVLHVNGKQHQTEMMDISGNTIYLISYSEYLTIIDIVADTLCVRKTVLLNQTQSPYHGIQVYMNYVYITPSNKAAGDDRIIVWNTEHDNIAHKLTSPDIGPNIRIKDIAFLSDTRIILLGNYKTINAMTNKGHTFNGFIGLYTHEFRELDIVPYSTTHFDSVTSKDGVFYATGSDLEGGYIYVGSTVDDKLSAIVKHPVQDFPHGITVYNDKLAYTSYATSAVYITDVASYAQNT